MSAIGYYVHLTAKGYNKTGINKQSQKPSITAVEALKNQKNILQNKIANYENVKNTKTLEKEINKLLDLLGGRASASNQNWDEDAKKWIENELDKEFNNLQKLDFSDISVDYLSLADKGVGRIKTNPKAYKNWREEVSNRINQLNYYTDNFLRNKNEKEYLQAKEKIQKLATGIYKDTYKILKDNMGELPNKKVTTNLIKEINDIIKQYAARPAINLQGGTFFEKTLQLIPEVGNNLAEKEVNERINLYYKGKDKVKVEINEDFFNDKSWKVNLGDITNENNTHYSQGKIDVSYEWEGQKMNISAKNINLKNGNRFISTQSDSPLLYMLQDENSDFVNHYLNLYSRHAGREHLDYANQKNEYFKTLKLTLAYKGLTGASYGRGDNKVNVFVINKRIGFGKSQVRVISIADILKKFEENDGSMLGLTVEGAGNIKNLYQNKYVKDVPSGIARINSILIEMHKRKVSTSFNSALLDKIF